MPATARRQVQRTLRQPSPRARPPVEGRAPVCGKAILLCRRRNDLRFADLAPTTRVASPQARQARSGLLDGRELPTGAAIAVVAAERPQLGHLPVSVGIARNQATG